MVAEVHAVPARNRQNQNMMAGQSAGSPRSKRVKFSGAAKAKLRQGKNGHRGCHEQIFGAE
jgi:hypothetical protein